MSSNTRATLPDAASGSSRAFSAPITCPHFPGYTAGPTSATYALASSGVSLSALLAQAHSLAANQAAARLSQIRTRVGRGPPASDIA
jgi:hypothetical protein